MWKHSFLLQPGIAIGPILFVVAILAILVGALAAGSSGFGNSTAKDAARVQATSLIQQGNSFKWAFERVYGNSINIEDIIVSMTFSSANSPNALFGKDGGGLLPLNPLKAAVPDTGVNTWRFVKDGNLPGIGNTGDDSIVVIGVKSEVICKAMNSVIFGRGSSQEVTLPVAADVATAVLNDASCSDATMASTASGCNLAANTFDISAVAAIDGRPQACVDDGNGNYYYYQLLLAK